MDNYTKLRKRIVLLLYEVMEKRTKTIEDLETCSIAITETNASMYEERKKLIYKNERLYAILTELNVKKKLLSELLDFAHNIEIETTENKN